MPCAFTTCCGASYKTGMPIECPIDIVIVVTIITTTMGPPCLESRSALTVLVLRLRSEYNSSDTCTWCSNLSVSAVWLLCHVQLQRLAMHRICVCPFTTTCLHATPFTWHTFHVRGLKCITTRKLQISYVQETDCLTLQWVKLIKYCQHPYSIFSWQNELRNKQQAAVAERQGMWVLQQYANHRHSSMFCNTSAQHQLANWGAKWVLKWAAMTNSVHAIVIQQVTCSLTIPNIMIMHGYQSVWRGLDTLLSSIQASLILPKPVPS